ncbi:hypothetical protein Lspi_0590 [Legionella spiritensis]|uniref:Uncharacterized protein n=1 Tax=Legionella spiritensis TaxID=452 RepID=A0A0W0Z8T8_LEGSP|nr:hypothetical protein Lspi_0590 [Legionella spiritensis]SNV36084.1 Uncharacterised protein [Legionella spiritensis]
MIINVLAPFFCKIIVARKKACGRIAGFMHQYYPALRLRLHGGLQKTLQKRNKSHTLSANHL